MALVLSLGHDDSAHGEHAFLTVELHSRPFARSELYATAPSNVHGGLVPTTRDLDAQRRELGLTCAFFSVLRSVDIAVDNIAGVGCAKHVVSKRTMP